MAILAQSLPQSPDVSHHSASLRSFSERRSAAKDGGAMKLYVAVGLSPEKTLRLLRWTFRRFDCREIGLLHVHQPSPLIPTLLGKIPVNQANEELVSSYRRIERETTSKILQSYKSYCLKAQVKASIIVTEADQIHNGIADLVAQHGIRKLIMGSTTDKFFKLKGSSSKEAFTAKNVPAFCEIWFVNKGRHIWTREANQVADSFLPAFHSEESVCKGRFPLIPHNYESNFMLYPECNVLNTFVSDPQGYKRNDQTEPSNSEIVGSEFNPKMLCDASLSHFHDTLSLTSAAPWSDSPPDETVDKDNLDPEILYGHLKEVTEEVQRLKKSAFAELIKRKQVEADVAEAFDRVKASKVAHEYKIKIREELEIELRNTRMQHAGLAQQRDKALSELQSIMATIASLESQSQELALCRVEVAGELQLIESSMKAFNFERHTNHRHGEKYTEQRIRSKSSAVSCNHNWVAGFKEESNNLSDFSLSDLQTATCDFSESFKLGQGGYGCVYKGEIMDRTVMIKKLHPHNVRGQMEFQQEVYVSKLRHPHLLALLGTCPEALSLVYEYMPNGTLQDCLYGRTMSQPMAWKVRTQIIAEISSVLQFLHSFKPEKIVHGDLKPENIFIDSDLSCKIGNFGICRRSPEDNMYHPFFSPSIEPQGAFPYADPEYQKTRELTPKSDVYALGMIALQLLTGKPPSRGLVGEVRRAFHSENLKSILDPSAGEWPSGVARSLVKFALEFTELNSRDRPDLTPEAVKELEQLYMMQERPAPPFFLCPILQEIMHDPQVAADGFTYEGKAIRDWLENERDTSPMTNLKLKHLNLTPNHALRNAIQDWLCQS